MSAATITSPTNTYRANRDAGAGNASDYSIGDGPVGAPIATGDHGDHGREHKGSAHALENRPADEECHYVRRRGRERRTGTVYDESGKECTSSSPSITELAAGDHQSRHRECVEGDDRLNDADRRIEVVDQLADRYVHHGLIEDHEELCGREHGQRAPLHLVKLSILCGVPKQPAPRADCDGNVQSRRTVCTCPLAMVGTVT